MFEENEAAYAPMVHAIAQGGVWVTTTRWVVDTPLGGAHLRETTATTVYATVAQADEHLSEWGADWRTRRGAAHVT